MKPDGMLAYYGERLPTVEINNTFYQMPKVAVLESWVRSTPGSFRFAIKASRRITHMAPQGRHGRRLPGVPLQEPGRVGRQARSGAVSVAPFLRRILRGLREFLALLAAGSWCCLRIPERDLVRGRRLRCPEERRAALCLSEREDNAPPPLVETASWGYVRLRLETYSEADLEQWAGRLAGTAGGAKSTSTSCTSPLHRLTRRG